VAGVGAVLLGELLTRPSGSKIIRIVACVLAGTLAYQLVLTSALRIGLPAGDLKGVTALTLVVAIAAERYLGVLGGSARRLRQAAQARVPRAGQEMALCWRLITSTSSTTPGARMRWSRCATFAWSWTAASS
jgi:putative ABC transport system permease protein